MSLVEDIARADDSPIACSKNARSVSPPPPPLFSPSSSVETDFIAITRSHSKKRELDDDELIEQRRSANRRAANKSRLRKKLLIGELQDKVSDLMNQIVTLKEENKSLCHRLESESAENRHLLFSQHQSRIVGQATGGMHGVPTMNLRLLSNPGGLLGTSGVSISDFLNGKTPRVGFDSSSMLY